MLPNPDFQLRVKDDRRVGQRKNDSNGGVGKNRTLTSILACEAEEMEEELKGEHAGRTKKTNEDVVGEIWRFTNPCTISRREDYQRMKSYNPSN